MRGNLSQCGVASLCSAFVLVAVAGCHRDGTTVRSGSPHDQTAPAEDLAAARKSFVTKLTVRGPAPQSYRDDEPPAGVQQVDFPSGDLKLKGWLSAAPDDGKRHLAVVYLHGGWSFSPDDWRDAAPFAEAGFVLFMPMLRAENGNPGLYESFYGEVDDAIAAGRYVSSLPQVDGNNVFVAGHSVGAVLTCLAAMMLSPYKAAAALDGYVDMESWAAESPQAYVPYNRFDPEEVRIRNPMAFVASLKCPLTLYASDGARGVNEPLAVRAKQLGKACELVTVFGDHRSMVAPAVQKAIAWFQSEAGK
jgi:dipeptidyl aminopeptidase/acylaminoacyl peptidase